MTQPFTMIDNKLILDTSLSGDSYRMISYLLSKPDGWKLLVKDVAKTFGFCRNKVYKILKEAIKAGYLERRQVRSSGKYQRAYYVLKGQDGQGNLDLERRECHDHKNHVPHNDTWLKPLDYAVSDDPCPQKPCTTNQDTYIRKNTNTLTITPCTQNVPLEKNLQGQAAGAAETDSLREPLKSEDMDLPTGKAHNDPKGRDVDTAHWDKPQPSSCQDNIHDTGSAGLARAENPQQEPQTSINVSESAKTDFLQNCVKRMKQAAGDALSARMGKDFEPGRWLQGGYDLELDILPIIERRCAGKPAGSIFTWSFFTDAIADRHAKRTAPLPKVEYRQEARAHGRPASYTGNYKRLSDEELEAFLEAA